MAKRLASGGAFNSSTGTNSGQSGFSRPLKMEVQRPFQDFGNSGGGGAYGGLESVQNGTQQISQSLDSIKNSLGGQGGGSYPQPAPTLPPEEPVSNYKKGGKVKKHFNLGGFNQDGAYGGLQSIQQGEGQVGQSLNTISGALGDNNRPQSINDVNGVYQPIQLSNVLGATNNNTLKKGGKVKAFKKGGSVKSSSSRGDGIAQRGFTRGKYC
jgi:hypothetical protein